MIVYGMIAYIGIAALVICYFVAKKLGDQVTTTTYNQFEDDLQNDKLNSNKD